MLTLHRAAIWYVTPSESGMAWYHETEINGHRCTIIERPSINYVRWMASTNTETTDIEPAASLADAMTAAEDWARSH